MTTIEREYCSLMGLSFYDLSSSIIQGKPAVPTSAPTESVPEVQEIFNVNESQSKAIISSLSSSGFSLIQGPPGTGKTKTILGIVGAHLTGSPAAAPGIVSALESKPETLKKVLICAPSNAAVDELVLRLKHGVIGYHGQRFEPRVVRLGRSEAINSQVRELTLEDQVDQAVAKLELKSFDADGKLRQESKDLCKKRDDLRNKLTSTDSPLDAAAYEAADMQLREVKNKLKQIGHQLDLQREQSRQAARVRDSERRRLQSELLQKSQIICATLSGSAHNVLSSLQMKFETVIIDEAAQCIELSALIPLKYGCKQCIMVGDPNQLPPTVLSQAAASFKYEQSLFVRMFNQHKDNVHMLDTQFRMHPAISRFPSREFYGGKLLDGPNMANQTARNWHSKDLFSPYRFFDVRGQQQRSKSKSLYNKEEAYVAMDLFSELVKKFNTDSGKIGIISPYKQQVRVLRDVFRQKYGEDIFNEVDFNTIDGFQGQEKDVIILSCVRAEKDARGVGFLGDTRRMNVAVTRARSSMWILGNEQNLVQNPVWKRLIDDAKDRGMFTPAARGFLNDSRVVPVDPKPYSIPSAPHSVDNRSTSDRSANGGSSGSSKKRKNSNKSENPQKRRHSLEKNKHTEWPKQSDRNSHGTEKATPDASKDPPVVSDTSSVIPTSSGIIGTTSSQVENLPVPTTSGLLDRSSNSIPKPTSSGVHDNPQMPNSSGIVGQNSSSIPKPNNSGVFDNRKHSNASLNGNGMNNSGNRPPKKNPSIFLPQRKRRK